MRKEVGMAVVCLLLAGLVGCGGPAKVTTVPERVKGRPNWVPVPGEVTMYDKTIVEGEILQGIGVSEKKINFRVTRDTAYADALRRLAEQVKVHVEAVAKNTLGSWEDYLQKDLSTSVEELKEMVKTIVDVDLPGPKPIQEYEDPETGRYWVRVLQSSATTEKWLKNRLNQEAELRRLFVEAKCTQIADELQKDIDNLAAKEKEQASSIQRLLSGGK